MQDSYLLFSSVDIGKDCLFFVKFELLPTNCVSYFAFLSSNLYFLFFGNCLLNSIGLHDFVMFTCKVLDLWIILCASLINLYDFTIFFHFFFFSAHLFSSFFKKWPVTIYEPRVFCNSLFFLWWWGCHISYLQGNSDTLSWLQRDI